MPTLVVIAGPNGSGKSTLYSRLSKKIPSFSKIPFINPDDVARELFGSYLSTNTSEHRAQMLAAGREALNRREALLESGRSFGFETTLSGHTEIRMIKKAAAAGYDVIIIFVATTDPGLNIMRIKYRVENGGHFVAPEDVSRRWNRSLANIEKLHPFVSHIYLIDNSGERPYIALRYTSKPRSVRMALQTEEVYPEWIMGIAAVLSTQNQKQTLEEQDSKAGLF